MAINDENTRRLKQEIIQCLRDRELSFSTFKNKIENKNVVLFLGNTRSGKSTLVNYVLGIELEGYEFEKANYKIRTKGQSRGPEIGQGSLSCTTLPGVYDMQVSLNTVVVDLPGFEDNRGVVQDIINSLCISQIKYARTVKFVVVFDINDITCDNLRNFGSTLHQLQGLVCNYDKLLHCFCAIFTKDWKNYNCDEIAELMRNKILNVEELMIDKVLVKGFAENKKLIGIFKMPPRNGDVTLDLDVNVKGAINSCQDIDVCKCEIEFTLSENAQEALLQIYPEYTDTKFFDGQVNIIINDYNDYFSVEKYVFASYDTELEYVKQKLEKINSKLLRHKEAPYNFLCEIQQSLDELLIFSLDDEFKDNLKFIVIMDKSGMLQLNYKDMIIVNYKMSLENIYEKINNLLAKINDELTERRNHKFSFGASMAGGVVGAVPALAGVAKVVEGTVKTSVPLLSRITAPGVAAFGATEALVGTAAAASICVVGAAAAGAGVGSAYVLYKETYGKRSEFRRTQGRPN